MSLKKPDNDQRITKDTNRKPDFKFTKFQESSTDEPRKPVRKRIIPKQPDSVDVIPSLGSLMDDALSIVGSELARYKEKSKRGITLDLKEARVIANYIDVLTKCSREAREQARADDLSDLSNEELMQLATQLTKANPKTAAAVKALETDSKD